MEEINFTQVVRRGCGIDIHRDVAVATISGEGITTETRSYKTFSSSFLTLTMRHPIHFCQFLGHPVAA